MAKKLTDDEIVHALECCIESESRNDCEDLQCPACDEIGCFFMNQSTEYYPESLIQEMGKAVLEVLKQKDAEIEGLARLKVKLHKKYLEQKAEIERLNKRIEGQKHALFEQQAYTAELQTKFKTTKSEAYKEFAERLKETIPHYSDGYTTMECVMAAIRYIEKELTEGKEHGKSSKN